MGGFLAATWTSTAGAQTLSYGQRDTSKEFDHAVSNPYGLASDANRVYVISLDGNISVYSDTGTLVSTHTKSLPRNRNITGAMVRSGELWLPDRTNTSSFYVYGLNSLDSIQRTVSSSGFTGTTLGIAHDDDLFFIRSTVGPNIRVGRFVGSTVTRAPSYGDIRLSSLRSGLTFVTGPVLANGTEYSNILYVVDSSSNISGYVYDRDLATFTRQTDLNIALSSANNAPRDLAFDGSTMLVLNSGSHIYAYHVMTPTVTQVAGSPSLSAGMTSIVVTWEVPEVGEGERIDSYDLRYKVPSDSGYTELTAVSSTGSGSSRTYTLTNLVPLTEYEVSYRAVVDGTARDWSPAHTVETDGAYGHLLPVKQLGEPSAGVVLPTPESGSTVAPSTEGGFGVQPYRRAIAGLPAGTMWLTLSTIFGVVGGALFRNVNGSMMTRATIMCVSQVVFALILGGISTALLHLTILGTFSVGAISTTTGRGQRGP